MRKDDEATQFDEQSIDDNEWTEERDQNTLDHYLTRQLTVQDVIDFAEEIKSIVKIRSETFSEKIIISLTKQALEETRESRSDLVLWSDESRLKHEEVEVAAAWKRESIWQTCKISLSKSKEIFDAKLWEISDALKVALNIARNQKAVTIFLDSQTVIKKIRNVNNKVEQAITSQIYDRAQQLISKRHAIVIR